MLISTRHVTTIYKVSVGEDGFTLIKERNERKKEISSHNTSEILPEKKVKQFLYIRDVLTF